MMKESYRKMVVGGLLLTVLMMTGCGPYANTVVQLNREKP